ncbi:MAG: hypothetical protein ACE5H1_08605 [Thermodesulfobacteriota bacterium]
MNYHVNQEAIFYQAGNKTPQEIELSRIIPRSVRHTLLQMRLYDIRWLFYMSDDLRNELKKDIRHRISNRICQSLDGNGRFVIKTTLHRVTPNNIELKKKPKIYEMEFYCFNGHVIK